MKPIKPGQEVVVDIGLGAMRKRVSGRVHHLYFDPETGDPAAVVYIPRRSSHDHSTPDFVLRRLTDLSPAEDDAPDNEEEQWDEVADLLPEAMTAGITTPVWVTPGIIPRESRMAEAIGTWVALELRECYRRPHNVRGVSVPRDVEKYDERHDGVFEYGHLFLCQRALGLKGNWYWRVWVDEDKWMGLPVPVADQMLRAPRG